MIVNKHGSFYLRSGWGTKIIDAVKKDSAIFSPNNEQAAVDSIGLGRVMIKALRYWADALGLTVEEKKPAGIYKNATVLFNLIDLYDCYFQRIGSLLLMHRNLARNKEEATAYAMAPIISYSTSPLLAITFLYQSKDFLRYLSPDPLPSSLRST